MTETEPRRWSQPIKRPRDGRTGSGGGHERPRRPHDGTNASPGPPVERAAPPLAEPLTHRSRARRVVDSPITPAHHQPPLDDVRVLGRDGTTLPVIMKAGQFHKRLI